MTYKRGDKIKIEMGFVYIYALVDPRASDVPKYIGYTSDPYHRLKQHIDQKTNKHKMLWLKDLEKMKLTPEMIIIYVVEDYNQQFYEAKAIVEALDRGYKLLNSKLEIKTARQILKIHNVQHK